MTDPLKDLRHEWEQDRCLHCGSTSPEYEGGPCPARVSAALAALEADNAALRAMLRRVGDPVAIGEGRSSGCVGCACCGGMRGHAPGCELAALLEDR